MRKGLFAALAALAVLAPNAQAAERPHFHKCRDAEAGARCGHVRVPLDRLAPAGAKIRIGFELYRRRDRDRPSLGTMVDVEGGPGYSTTDSRSYFLELSRPLMDRRDLLLVDARGTGLSGPLDCPALRRTVDGLHPPRRPLRRPARRAGRPLHDAGLRRRPRRGARRARDRQGRPTTATRTARTSGRRSRSTTRTACARSCSTAPTRCRAPTRRSATSPRRPGAPCGSFATAARAAPRAARTRSRS